MWRRACWVRPGFGWVPGSVASPLTGAAVPKPSFPCWPPGIVNPTQRVIAGVEQGSCTVLACSEQGPSGRCPTSLEMQHPDQTLPCPLRSAFFPACSRLLYAGDNQCFLQAAPSSPPGVAWDTWGSRWQHAQEMACHLPPCSSRIAPGRVWSDAVSNLSHLVHGPWAAGVRGLTWLWWGFRKTSCPREVAFWRH